jgi:endo-1,3(4)-beta-glucanase
MTRLIERFIEMSYFRMLGGRYGRIFLVLGFIIIFVVLMYLHEGIFDAPLGVLNENSVTKSEFYYTDLALLEQKSAVKEVFIEKEVGPVPTNQWFSSITFTQASEPFFAYPLAVKMEGDGLGISYPQVVSTEKTIFASYVEDIRLIFAYDATSAIASYDDFSVEVAQRQENELLAITRVTHGSPFVFTHLKSLKAVSVRAPNAKLAEVTSGTWTINVGDKQFALFFDPQQIQAKQIAGNLSLHVLQENSLLSIAVLPDNSHIEAFRLFASDPIVGTRVEHIVNGEFLETHFSLETQRGQNTLWALLPWQMKGLKESPQSFGVYKTLKGNQQLLLGNKFVIRESATVPEPHLDISLLSAYQKEELRQFIKEDISRVSFPEEDTYFGGKKLYAVANLLDLSMQLDMAEEGKQLQKQLQVELDGWRERSLSFQGQKSKYFSYDPLIKGIVGEKASFGSELFNDHHFHYGYFIYAASILARYDGEYLERNEEFINLLVKDIANFERSDKNFPYLRVFDVYEGHSWASGTALFADGNNQESSSEAVNAWYAVYLWSKAIENSELENAALWLYNRESRSALENWLNPDLSEPRFVQFRHPFVSLVWGGKLDWATWFDAAPESILGIQLIPMSPGQLYLGQDAKRIQQNLTSVHLGTATKFKDYLIMYQALANPALAKSFMNGITDEQIDSANTKSYLFAWAHVLEAKKKQSPIQ